MCLVQTNTSKMTEISTEDSIQHHAMLEMARRIEENRYKYFVPNGRGEEFSTKLGAAGAFIGLYSAANGVGKTASAVNILANIIWPVPGGHPFIRGPLYQKFPYLKRIRIVSDPSVVDSIIKEMKHWFPKNRYVTSKGRKAYEAYWKTDTGFDIDIMTYDQDKKEFESANLGLIWFDEPPPKPIYTACIARLRRGGVLFITATPLEGSEWMYDDLITNPDNEAGGRFVVEAKMEDACKDHGIRGHLEHDNIQKLIAQYSEDEQQARVFGRFQHLTGLIYKEFRPEVHVIAPFQIDLNNYSVHQFLDPHPRTPDAAAWYAVDRQGTYFVVDELFIKCSNGDQELASRIKDKDSYYRIVERYGDPSMFIEDQHRQTSLALELNKYGLYYAEASKQRVAADREIHNALHYTQIGNNMIKAPRLYIFSTCQRHIWELNHYRWDEWTGKNALKKGPKQKPIDKDDHMIENLGRFLLSMPSFTPNILKVEEHHSPNDDPY